MEIGSWIWNIWIAVCTFSASVLTFEKQLNFTECWNYGRNRSIFEAPGVQNFNDCGRWNKNGFAPWAIWLILDNIISSSFLLSDKTIISGSDWSLYDAHKEGREIKIFAGIAGKCEDVKEIQNCFRGRSLLQNKKVLDVTELELKRGNYYYKRVYLWRVTKLDLTPNLLPVCLWNRDNTNDEHENFFSYSPSDPALEKFSFFPEQRCYEEQEISVSNCDLYGNSLCLSWMHTDSWSYLLLIERENRFYLRALRDYNSIHRGTDTWLDLLQWTYEITYATVDLAAMPKIPKLKTKTDFGPEQSFADCGFQPSTGRIRHKREDDEDKTPSARTRFITRGQNADSGQFPWHASLSFVFSDLYEILDFCGATLISKRTLVTAAHCLFEESGTLNNVSALQVTLGMHDRSKESEELWQKMKVANVVVHPSYKHAKFDFRDDIALIILAENVKFNAKVRPICLWNSDYDLNKIANRTGTAVGWGYTSNQTQPNILQRADLKIVSHRECYESKKKFFSVNLRPTENFCAGFPHNQTGACVGDSGGGFYIRESRRFFLRGVVSFGRQKKVKIDEEEIFTCNPSYYALFTDVTNYMQWIVDNKINQ